MLSAFQIKHMLNSKGQTATLTVVTYDNYDPAIGTIPETSLAYTVKAYFASFVLGEVDNVSSGSRTVLVGRADVDGVTLPEITSDDTISSASGDTVHVKSVQKIYDGSGVVCYLCMVEE